MTRKNNGFTLIEMSMVLVAIGLLIGALLGGYSLIRNTRLLSIGADVELYKNAVASFLDKYKYLPGDLPKATTFWRTDSNCPNTMENAVPKMETCDGNGDTYVGDSEGSALGDASRWHETYRFWQHLANAGFISGNYNGTVSSRSELGTDPGMNIPASKIPGNGFTLMHVIPGAASGVYSAYYHHAMIYGAPVGPRASTYKPALQPREAFMIDKKLDDGKPGKGLLLAFTPDLKETKDCADTSAEETAVYNIEKDDISCSLIFITGF